MTIYRPQNLRRNHAFTLVEIMIVVSIIGLLAAIALPNFLRARDNARLNTIYHNLRELDSAKEQWATENKKANGAVVADLTELDAYLRNGLHDVLSETYVPNPVGTPPSAELPSGVGLGPYEAGASIPAP